MAERYMGSHLIQRRSGQSQWLRLQSRRAAQPFWRMELLSSRPMRPPVRQCRAPTYNLWPRSAQSVCRWLQQRLNRRLRLLQSRDSIHLVSVGILASQRSTHKQHLHLQSQNIPQEVPKNILHPVHHWKMLQAASRTVRLPAVAQLHTLYYR